MADTFRNPRFEVTFRDRQAHLEIREELENVSHELMLHMVDAMRQMVEHQGRMQTNATTLSILTDAIDVRLHFLRRSGCMWRTPEGLWQVDHKP